jgi:hypothetical protein
MTISHSSFIPLLCSDYLHCILTLALALSTPCKARAFEERVRKPQAGNHNNMYESRAWQNTAAARASTGHGLSATGTAAGVGVDGWAIVSVHIRGRKRTFW